MHRFDEMAVMVNDRIEDPADADVEYYVGLEHLDSDSLAIRRWGSPSDVEATKLRFRAGDIIFGRRRVYQRKLAVASFDGICSAHAMVLRAKPEVALPEFLPRFMQSDLFMERAKEISVGSLSPTINWKTLAKEEFALPPPEEQLRIADGLAASDSTTESLLRALDAAHRLRGALLAQLFPADGSAASYVTLGELIGDGLLAFQTGPFGTVLAAAEYTETGWPIVNPTNIKSGRIVRTDRCVSDSTAERLHAYRMKAGDILLARKGEIDKAVLVGPEESGWIAGSDTILLRADAATLAPSYLLLFLQSPGTGKLLRSLAHGTVMPGLNEGMLARLRIRRQPLAEQASEIGIVEKLDTVTGCMREHRERALRLRRALLSDALQPVALES